MNPRIKKELRSLLPAFGVTVAATVISALAFNVKRTAGIYYNNDSAAGIVSFIFGGGCVMISACSFGNEFYAKTMTSLLAQPISRLQIWREKLQTLGGLLIVAYLVWMFSVSVLVQSRSNFTIHNQEFNEVASWMFLVPVIVFCSAPGISLLVMNIIGSMVAVALFPIALMVTWVFINWLISYLYTPLVAGQFEKYIESHVYALVLLYCGATYVFGYRRFRKFESLDSRAQEVRLPVRVEKTIAPWIKRIIPGYTGPIASLIRKELELQRLSYLLAGLVCLWLPIAAIINEIHPSGLTISMMIAPFAIFVILTPFITGGVSMAEERNLGMANWHFTLPPSARMQWHVKFLVTVTTGLGLGVVLPVILVFLGKLVFGISSDVPNEPLVRGFFVVGYLLVFSVIMYASSISTNPIRAIIAAIGILSGAGALFAFATEYFPRVMWAFNSSEQFSEISSYVLYYDRTIIIAAMVAMMCALLILIYLMTKKNFQVGEWNSRSAGRQLSVLFVTYGVMTVFAQTLALMWRLRHNH